MEGNHTLEQTRDPVWLDVIVFLPAPSLCFPSRDHDWLFWVSLGACAHADCSTQPTFMKPSARVLSPPSALCPARPTAGLGVALLSFMKRDPNQTSRD